MLRVKESFIEGPCIDDIQPDYCTYRINSGLTTSSFDPIPSSASVLCFWETIVIAVSEILTRHVRELVDCDSKALGTQVYFTAGPFNSQSFNS